VMDKVWKQCVNYYLTRESLKGPRWLIPKVAQPQRVQLSRLSLSLPLLLPAATYIGESADGQTTPESIEGNQQQHSYRLDLDVSRLCLSLHAQPAQQ
jgi:hypothetical protein